MQTLLQGLQDLCARSFPVPQLRESPWKGWFQRGSRVRLYQQKQRGVRVVP